VAFAFLVDLVKIPLFRRLEDRLPVLRCDDRV